jgi:hypothetical protein
MLSEIQDVVGRARQGDETALPRLRELLAQFPRLAETYGDLALHAQRAWVALAAGPDFYMKECLLHETATLRQELAGPSPGPVERLLAERVVACRLQMHYFDAVEAQALAAGGTPRLAAHRARRQALAHRNYLTALAALTTLRRLLPAVVAVPAAVLATPAPTPAAGQGAGTNGHRKKKSVPAAILAAPAPAPAAANGAGTNGQPTNNARGKFDPHNRVADLFDPAANGMGPRAGAKHQAPCSTEV